MRQINLLRAHGSPTNHLYRYARCRCVACLGAKSDAGRDYYAAHTEERAEYGRDYREERAERSRRYYAEHPDEEAERSRKYRAEHPEEIAAKDRNRRARKLSNGGTHTAEDVRAQYARQKGACFWCPKKVGDTYHIDHVMPVILGGSSGPGNLVIACPTCNMKKHSKHPMDFAGILF